MTRSITYVLSKPNKFIRIDNPNPLDDAKCYICVNALKDKQLLNAVRNAYDHETTNFDLCRMVNQRLAYADMFDWKTVAKTINACAKKVEYIDNINTTLNKSARKIWPNK